MEKTHKRDQKTALAGPEAHIKVKVIPRSSKNQILMRDEDAVTVKVTAPPTEGSANKALVALLSDKLRVPKGSIEIVSGRGSRLKRVRIHGLSPAEVNALLAPCGLMP